jgi:hypothetical protein
MNAAGWHFVKLRKWLFCTDISEEPISPILRGQETNKFPKTLTRSYHSTLYNIPKENRSYLQCNRNLKSSMGNCVTSAPVVLAVYFPA